MATGSFINQVVNTVISIHLRPTSEWLQPGDQRLRMLINPERHLDVHHMCIYIYYVINIYIYIHISNVCIYTQDYIQHYVVIMMYNIHIHSYIDMYI